MTPLLKKAFTEAAKLPGDRQDEVDAWLLEELAAEERWNKAFADSADSLARLASEALAEHRAGKTPRQPRSGPV